MLLSTGLAVRLACRNGALNRSTAGVAPGYVQGNVAILPKDLAADFLRFCQQNPKPCPVIGVSEVGDPHIPALGLDLDIRTAAGLPGLENMNRVIGRDRMLLACCIIPFSWWSLQR